MTLQNDIKTAIKLRRKVRLDYKGDGMRVVCPHVLYISTTSKILLDAYQVSGFSKHNEQIPGWRPFDTAEIINFQILEESFNIAEGYNPTSSRYANSILKL